MTDLICPKCGKKSSETRFIEAFCVDCYPVNIRCPTKVEIEQCKNCEKIRLSGDWTEYSRKKIGELVISRCRGEFSEAHYDLDSQTASFTISKGREQITTNRQITVEPRITMCLYCSRISGGYFEGIIQLRGDRKKVERVGGRLISILAKKTFINKEEEKDGGLDIFVGSSKAVTGLLSDLRIKADMTSKLVGRKEGKRLYRTTFLIRL